MAKNTNLAYALRNFETQETREPKPKIKKLERSEAKKAAKNTNAFRLVLGMLYVVELCGARLFARTELIREDKEMRSAEKELSSVDSDNERLSLQLDSELSLSAIEQKATEEDGMVKADHNQINYIKVEKENKVKIKESKNEMFSKIGNTSDQIKEYIGG